MAKEPASEEEIRHTVAVMGGEDWEWWIDALKDADLSGYREEFYKLFGFEWPGVDYSADVDANVEIESMSE